MFTRIFNSISYLSYYLFLVKDIELDEDDYLEYDIDILQNKKTYLIESVKYLIWRKSSLVIMLPLILIDFALNIVSYQKDWVNLDHYENNVSLTLESWHNTSDIIGLLHPKKADDYLTFYTVVSTIAISLEFIFSSLALLNHRNWHTSSSWLRYSLFTSVFWIYLVFLNPVMNYLNFKSNSDSNTTLYSYTYIFVLGFLLKEVLPIFLSLMDGISWASINLKYLYPKNIIVGYVFKYGSVLYLLTTGFILLLVNQLLNSYLLSAAFGLSILGYIIPFYLYRNKMTLHFEEDEYGLRDMILRNRFIKTSLFLVSFVLICIYCLTKSNPFLMDLYHFYVIDILHFIIKISYRAVFFKILIGDTLFTFLLQLAKHNTLYANEEKEETKRLRDIENQLYIKTFY